MKKILLKILNLLEKNFEKFEFKKELPGVDSKKNLVYYYNSSTDRWTPYQHPELTIRKALAYYFENTPENLESDGWSPLRVNKYGNLSMNPKIRYYPSTPPPLTTLGDYVLTIDASQRLLVYDFNVISRIETLTTSINEIKTQIDKLQFTAQNNLKVQETAES